MTNAYPEKVTVPYQRTTVEMGLVVTYLKSLAIPKQIKCMAYIMFRNESGNGKSGFNNNYGGIQADSGRWQEKYDDAITGVVIKKENATDKMIRFFCAFKSWQTCLDMMLDRVKARGLYIGGQTNFITQAVIINAEDLALAYYREWVTGQKDYVPDSVKINNFLSMYRQADIAF